jgi:hypothetical protein
MAAFLTAAAAAIGSSSIGGALVRILVAYGVSRLINKATGNTNTPDAVDQGIRLQAAPDTTNPIPVLYGSAYLGGKITDAQLVDANKTMWYCLTLAETPRTVTTRLSDGAAIITTVDEVYWNNQRVYFKSDGITIDYIVNQDGVVDTSPRDLVKIYLYNSSVTPTRPSDLLEYLPSLPTLHGDARTLMPGWISDERMIGLTFALVRISYNRDKGITGLPELQFRVSNNLFKPGDALHSFLRNKISGAGLSNSQIDTASLIALNAYADDTVSYYDEEDGQTKTLANRYQINGVVNPANSVMTNLQKLAGNAGCFVSYDIGTGLWGVTINKDQSAVLAFDDSNIISGIDLTGTNLDSMYNAVEVEFPHRELRDQMDKIRIDLPTEYRNANEPDNILQLKLDLINEPLQARELGYLELYQNRMDQIVTFTTDYSKINTEAGDVITVSTDVYGWTLKPFRVVRVREVESETGGLAVEITAQEYDSTMYTAGGVPRRPRVPTEPIAIPDIAVIGTPAAPTIAELNNVAVPALDITGVTPSGIVDRFEYWYSSDAGATYRILGSRANSNGSPYAQGTSLTFRAASLPAGSYLFRVRGGNEKAFGEFSPTTSKTWAPVQVTDQVNLTSKVSDSTNLLPVLAMGALAYFAYQKLYPEVLAAIGDSALGNIFGIPSSAVQTMKNAAGNFKLIQVGDSIQTPYNNDTITFIAGDGIEITAVADDGTITIAATGSVSAGVNKIIAGTGITVTPAEGTGDVTISLTNGGSGGGEGPVDSGGKTSGDSYVLNGSVFPCTYDANNQDKPAIFAHGNMVIATSSYDNTIQRDNIVTPDTILTPILTTFGDTVPAEPPAISYDTDQFTGGPSTASTEAASEAAARAQAVALANALYGSTWTETSFNEVRTKLNDGGTYTTTYILRVQYPISSIPGSTDTRFDNYRYYSKCVYNEGVDLSQQSWSEWKKWKEPITESKQIIIGYTNPPPENKTVGYIVDGEYTPGGLNLKNPSQASFDYNPFIPNVPIYSTTNVSTDYQQVKCAAGELVVFGVCNRDLGDTVPFATNTIFGLETADYVSKLATVAGYPGAEIVYGNSIYVTASPSKVDTLFWSTDTINWTKVKDVTFTGGATTDATNTGKFKLAPFNPVSGKFLAWRNIAISTLYPEGNNHIFAFSTDGKTWTESNGNIGSGIVTKININPAGHYIANTYRVSMAYVKTQTASRYSTDGGTTWNTMAFMVSDNVSWDSTNNRWVDGDGYFASVTSSSKTAFTVQSGVQTFSSYLSSYSFTKPSSVMGQYNWVTVPNHYVFAGIYNYNLYTQERANTQYAYGNNKIYVLYNNFTVAWASPGYGSGQIDSRGTGIVYETSSVKLLGMYTISGNTITAASYDATSGLTSFLEYDSTKNWMWALQGSYPSAFPSQVYAQGTTVKWYNGGSNAANWFSKANNLYFQGNNTYSLMTVTPASTAGTYPMASYNTISAVTKYSALPVAYATEYKYPGVGGTPVIYRAGDYGVGAYSSSVALKATYST